MNLRAPKGTQDIFGEEIYNWQYVESVIRKLCDDFFIDEIRTPTFEHSQLFQRGVGETTDIVQKELFSFVDRGGRDFSLRPEMTASIARAYIQNALDQTPQPSKLFYIGNAFRAERPQKGRYNEFHQFGVEIIGSHEAAADAEAISVAYEFLKRLGIDNTIIKINSIGCNDCREKYNKALEDFINSNADQMCDTCKERAERNPLRVLDCKNEGCQKVLEDAPIVLDYLEGECVVDFEKVQSYLTNLKIPFEVDAKLVRGLDYYTKTVFEIISSDLGAQSAVCGGGRYDNLIEECGGKETGSCGFAIGLERIIIILEEQNKLPKNNKAVDIYIGSIGEKGFIKAQSLIYELRKKGISAEGNLLDRSVRAQFKFADKINARFSCLIGEDEMETGKVSLKNMETGSERETAFEGLYEYISKSN